MITSFWRFAYNEQNLKEILSSESLTFPELSCWPEAKNNTEEKIISSLREGHFVLLANFDKSSEVGIIRGVGKVIKKENTAVAILWKKTIPSWSITPSRQGGVQEWVKEGVFCFAADPAKRYKFQERISKLFK